MAGAAGLDLEPPGVQQRPAQSFELSSIKSFKWGRPEGYPLQKFDSDTERRFAVILERDAENVWQMSVLPKLIGNELVREIYAALEVNNDLTATWAEAKHSMFVKIFGKAPD